MNKETLIRYIEDKVSASEREDILSWIEGSEENCAFFSRVKADWVFRNMPYTTAGMEKACSITRHRKPGKSRSLSKVLIRTAAILFIPAVISAACLYFLRESSAGTPAEGSLVAEIPVQEDAFVEYFVNPGVKGKVTLPDGSRVWLNSNSLLKCPDRFDPLMRNVELSGEAYFEVEGNEQWPMYIKTSKGVTIIVSGTVFNVSSYENDRELKFTLVSGNVTLYVEKTKEKIIVNPEDEIIIPDKAATKSSKKSGGEIYYNTAWKDGCLLFDNTGMEDVIKKMERWYGINISVADRSILSYRFTASFNSESVSQVLELLKITSNIDYSIKDNQVALFPKK